MHARITLAAAVVVAICSTFVPARAASGGCEVVTAGQSVGSCRYTATGPGTYDVETLSGFRIEVSDDNGVSFHPLASHFGTGDVVSAIAAETGPLATKAGELVQISILQAITPAGTRYQDGHIKAGS